MMYCFSEVLLSWRTVLLSTCTAGGAALEEGGREYEIGVIAPASFWTSAPSAAHSEGACVRGDLIWSNLIW